MMYEPVCGCDDVTYGNVCSAHGAGVSVLRMAGCDPATLPREPEDDPMYPVLKYEPGDEPGETMTS
eukprot:CAMPEP_0201942294 /NCGR_PEP_ID=MMETSP0903-20130614/48778_1 /ASSEMBLY_ACC=CAM_ASM_000552 /TAXON_ID=420261 /ORGANISM="Thalassiosira antarctica, Strain CCMP982" /LENGTH=65 /DNA_ID=CAMNT_0048484635 /DNA_START=15 /DNA_END=208 /DNA_ORIENTATION=-